MSSFFFTVLPRFIFRTQPKVYGGAFYKNSNQILAVNYFHKKAPSYMFDWISNAPLLPVRNKERNVGRRFTSTSFATHLFLLGWLKLNLALLLDQLRLA